MFFLSFIRNNFSSKITVYSEFTITNDMVHNNKQTKSF